MIATIAPEFREPFWLGPEESDKACLLIHGFMGTPSEMRGLGEELAARGVRVYGMLVAGHDGDPEVLIRTGSREWVASAEQALTLLAAHRFVFIAGLSMGGALALRLASLHPERITGVAALSCLVRVSADGWQGRVLPLVRVVRYFVKWIYPLARANFNDPRIQKIVLDQARLRDPEITIDFQNPSMIKMIKEMVRIPIPAMAELMRLTDEERHDLPQMRTPLCIINSRSDQTVKPASALELFKLASAASPKTLHWLEKSDHVITTGAERAEVARIVSEFIETTVGAQTS